MKRKIKKILNIRARTVKVITLNHHLWILLLLVLFGSSAGAQSRPGTATDLTTPPGLSPGSPAGAYALSGFESVNPYNGGLNFSLPLLHIGGRGSAEYTMMLPIEQKWRVNHT